MHAASIENYISGRTPGKIVLETSTSFKIFTASIQRQQEDQKITSPLTH